MRPNLGPISRHPDLAPCAGQATPAVGQRVDTEPRSARYLAALAMLDTSATAAPAELARIVEDIHREFTERWAALPLGIVSRCYLGHPFEVHTVAPDGGIVEHYELGQPLPGVLERARSFCRTDTYLAVEVYANRMVCLRPDGSTVTVGGGDT